MLKKRLFDVYFMLKRVECMEMKSKEAASELLPWTWKEFVMGGRRIRKENILQRVHFCSGSVMA